MSLLFISLVTQNGKAIINNIYKNQYWTQLNKIKYFTTGYECRTAF